MARLILDTGVLIAGVRGRVDLDELTDGDDIALPAVVAEYLAGTLLDADPGRAAAQRAFLGEVLETVPVHPCDLAVADHHAALPAHVRRAGASRGAHDLIIAATGRATDWVVVTTDERAGFGDLPDVRARIRAG